MTIFQNVTFRGGTFKNKGNSFWTVFVLVCYFDFFNMFSRFTNSIFSMTGRKVAIEFKLCLFAIV